MVPERLVLGDRISAARSRRDPVREPLVVARPHGPSLARLHDAVVARHRPVRTGGVAVLVWVAQHVAHLVGSGSAGVVQEEVSHVGPARSGMDLHHVVLAGGDPLHVKGDGVARAGAAAVRAPDVEAAAPGLLDRRLPGVLRGLELRLCDAGVGLEPDADDDLETAVPLLGDPVRRRPAVDALGHPPRALVPGEEAAQDACEPADGEADPPPRNADEVGDPDPNDADEIGDPDPNDADQVRDPYPRKADPREHLAHPRAGPPVAAVLPPLAAAVVATVLVAAACVVATVLVAAACLGAPFLGAPAGRVALVLPAGTAAEAFVALVLTGRALARGRTAAHGEGGSYDGGHDRRQTQRRARTSGAPEPAARQARESRSDRQNDQGMADARGAKRVLAIRLSRHRVCLPDGGTVGRTTYLPGTKSLDFSFTLVECSTSLLQSSWRYRSQVTPGASRQRATGCGYRASSSASRSASGTS